MREKKGHVAQKFWPWGVVHESTNSVGNGIRKISSGVLLPLPRKNVGFFDFLHPWPQVHLGHCLFMSCHDPNIGCRLLHPSGNGEEALAWQTLVGNGS